MAGAIGLDTNILARYYVEPAADDAAERRQCAQAAQLVDSGQPLAVCKTVLLELEWVLRGAYGYSTADIGRALTHLLAQPHIEVEDRPRVEQALRNYASGLDFADALHHASYGEYASMASFDDRLRRRSTRMGLQPPVKSPQQ